MVSAPPEETHPPLHVPVPSPLQATPPQNHCQLNLLSLPTTALLGSLGPRCARGCAPESGSSDTSPIVSWICGARSATGFSTTACSWMRCATPRARRLHFAGEVKSASRCWNSLNQLDVYVDSLSLVIGCGVQSDQDWFRVARSTFLCAKSYRNLAPCLLNKAILRRSASQFVPLLRWPTGSKEVAGKRSGSREILLSACSESFPSISTTERTISEAASRSELLSLIGVVVSRVVGVQI